MVSSTFAVSQQRRAEIDNIDIITTEDLGQLGLLWNGNANQNSDTTNLKTASNTGTGTLGNAVRSADMVHQRVRAGIHGGSLTRKGSKGNGKGFGKGFGKDGKGKDCKSDKSEKGKAGSKAGGKGLGKGLGPGRPTRSPTFRPSSAPTMTDSPTNDECVEDTHSPTVSPAPSESPTASPRPTVSMSPSESPTISNAPSVSFAPSNPPSVSPKPSSGPSSGQSDMPIVSIPVGGAEANRAKSFCQLMDAQFIENGSQITIWNPALEKEDNVKEATAAMNDVVDVPISVAETETFKLSVSFEVESDELGGENSAEIVASALDIAITPPLALTIVNCREAARAGAMDYYEEYAMTEGNGRNLQGGVSSLFVTRNWSCGEVTDCVEGRCTMDCFTDSNYMGPLTSDGVRALMLAVAEEYFPILDNVHGWYVQKSHEGNIEIVTTQGPAISNLETGSRQRQAGMRAGPFIGAATGLLAVLLLMMLFVRRRSRYSEEEVSHLKLDEDAEDDTYYNGSDDNSVTRHQYNSRDIHIVGEGDSVISHWTGYTGRNQEVSYKRSGLMKDKNSNLSPSDVHQCSSATCDICVESRQAGVNFIKTGATALPVRTHSLPSDASREYMAEDTVEL